MFHTGEPGGSQVTELGFCHAGQLNYAQAWAWQRSLRERRRSEGLSDVLLHLEHPPTFTSGRSSRPEHLKNDADTLSRLGFDLHEVERGGSVTYHGPGQLVGYPIMDLRSRGRDVHRFIRQLEQVLISALGFYGIDGHTREDWTGVWVGDSKIASIGIHVRHWITMHGFALNVATDLSHFSYINPCGLDSDVMTSLAEQLGTGLDMEEVSSQVSQHFAREFDCQLQPFETEAASFTQKTLPHTPTGRN